MARSNLLGVVTSLKSSLNEVIDLAGAAEQWASVRFPAGTPKFTSNHKEIVIKIAFLQSFLAWEEFLDESFILYMLGMRPPRGYRRPTRLFKPSKRKEAMRLIVGDRRYADWTQTAMLRERARLYFKKGEPYDSALSIHQNMFQDMNTIRNAIAHSSEHSREQFKKLVRRNLGTYPSGITIAKFLRMQKPGITPAITFIDYYLTTVSLIADSIVPN